MLGISESAQLTTHPDPCSAAPSALTFCINASKEPKCVSIAHPSEPLGGSPPPSCTRGEELGKRTAKDKRLLIKQDQGKKTYTNRS